MEIHHKYVNYEKQEFEQKKVEQYINKCQNQEHWKLISPIQGNKKPTKLMKRQKKPGFSFLTFVSSTGFVLI